MFKVHIAPEAKELILSMFSMDPSDPPGLMIHRQGPTGDSTRSSGGGADWKVERPIHTWHAQVFEIGKHHTDLLEVEGIPVWLALLPRDGEEGVELTVKNGELYVDAISTIDASQAGQN